MQRNWPRGPRVVEKGRRQMPLFAFRQRGSVVLHTDGRFRRYREVGALRLILHRVAPIGTVRRPAEITVTRNATIANPGARIESIQGLVAPRNLILFFSRCQPPSSYFPVSFGLAAFYPCCEIARFLRGRSKFRSYRNVLTGGAIALSRKSTHLFRNNRGTHVAPYRHSQGLIGL